MGRDNNTLYIWGNKESMNLNPMILTNIQSSTYFKQKLFELKTYHEVIDEIYYRVNHLEPWEKGSRRTQGLTGMCGGVRGVGGGGIVSTAFCLLYKLYTLKLTRKQVIGLITHKDSPYIRALGFMYIRYTQNPQDLFDWYCDYLDDEEELDVKAGGGITMTIGQMLRQWLTKLEWFDTLFPRIPVPIQKEILDALRDRYGNRVDSNAFYDGGAMKASKRSPPPEIVEALKGSDRKKQRISRSRSRSRESGRDKSRDRSRSRSKSRSRSRDSRRRREREERHRSTSRRRHRSRSRTKSRSKSRSRTRSKDSSDRHHRHHKHKHSKHHRNHKERDDSSERKDRRDEARSSKNDSSSKRSKDD